jgi:DNA invertase Pin-like site-specific DNA recombinase
VLTGQGAAIDTTTPAGKLVFGIFASLAEFERDLISERTRVGLASASARASPTEVLTTLLYGSFILSPDALRNSGDTESALLAIQAFSPIT